MILHCFNLWVGISFHNNLHMASKPTRDQDKNSDTESESEFRVVFRVRRSEVSYHRWTDGQN